MPARVCLACDIRMPINIMLACPVCGEPTKWSSTAQPDVNWRQRAEQMKLERGEDTLLTADGIPSLSNQNVRVRTDDKGYHWVNQIALTRAGLAFSYLSAGYLLDIGGVLYELQGYNAPKREWWVRTVQSQMEDAIEGMLSGN